MSGKKLSGIPCMVGPIDVTISHNRFFTKVLVFHLQLLYSVIMEFNAARPGENIDS